MKDKEQPQMVKTTIALPEPLWRAAKIRAMDDRTDLRTVLIRALERHLSEHTATTTTTPKKASGAK